MLSYIITLREYLAALREADQRFENERDRRYAEVGAARAEALKIKEVADATALQLARTIQDYKDAKANELREQISRERGHYVSQEQFKPVADFVTSQQGSSKTWIYVGGLIWGLVLLLITYFLRG